jgi:hypothetical protein
MVHVVQANSDICSIILILMLMSMPSHFHTQEVHHQHQHHQYHHTTTSLHTPVRVCSWGIEAAIAMHASPSFCIAVTDDDTGDGADDDDDDGTIVGWLGWPVGWPVGLSVLVGITDNRSSSRDCTGHHTILTLRHADHTSHYSRFTKAHYSWQVTDSTSHYYRLHMIDSIRW